ncbi:MAG: PAS domain S-box protein, partial [Syntrophus sp. (in: bacteria)]
LSEPGLILEANLTAAALLDVARGALVRRPLSRFILPEDQDVYYRHHKQLIETQPADSISSQQTCELRMVKQDMTPFWARMEATTSKDIDGAPVCRVVMSDVTEHKRAEEEIQRNDSRLKRLVDVLQYQSENVQDFLDYSLDQVIQLTGSKIGYIYHYHEDRKMFVLNTWSKEVMVECTVANPSNCYELDRTGIWGEAVRQRRPIIVNDFKAAHPLKKGYPEGHVHLLKFMTVPIFKEGSIVGVVGLANKETDYEETDILQASLLMEAVWKVTERMYAEQKLQEQYKFLQTLMDAMPSPIFYKGTQGIYLGCNRAFAEFNGLTKEEMIGKSVYELWKKELADIYYKADSQLLQNPGVQIYEASLRHADGTEHPVIFYKATFNNQDGTLGGLIGSFLDISDRKRAEEALRGSEERFRLLIETTGDMIYSVNTKGFLTYVNPTMERTLGYPHNELEGKSFAWIVAPECIDLVKSNFKRAMKGEPVPVYEVLLIRKDGTTFSVEFNVATIYDLEGNPVGRYGIGRNVTDRIRSEETLRDSEARFRQVFDNMADGMAIYEAVDDGGDFVFVDINRRGQILSSISYNDVIGKRVTETFPAVEKIGLLDIFRHVWRTGEAQDHPISLYEDGRIQQWVENHVFKLPSGLIAALYSDKSEKYRAEEERHSMEKQLFQAQKMEAIGTLAGGIAHDFNNILGAIIGYTELAVDEDRQDRRIHDLQEVLKGAERAGNLVKQILSFSRQDNQEKKPLDIKILLKEAIKFLRASIPSTIEIHQHITADTCNILADPTQIYQVVMNLVTNAAYAMKKTGGVLKIELSVITLAAGEIVHHPDLRPGPYVKLSVGDTGYGIDQAHINRIFDPFFTTKDKGEGTGLGLSVVYGIVKSHDGVVNVYSEPGKGATFNVYLPGIAHSGVMSGDMVKPLVGGTERILFVDDEHALVNMGRQMLSSLGYDVTGVTSSTEALVLLRSEPARFDLVITDMTMPKMTGIDLSREIMKIRPDIPIILCSGLSEPDTEDQAKLLGIRAYCLKPLTKRHLSRAIRESLDGHENSSSA